MGSTAIGKSLGWVRLLGHLNRHDRSYVSLRIVVFNACVHRWVFSSRSLFDSCVDRKCARALILVDSGGEMRVRDSSHQMMTSYFRVVIVGLVRN